MLTVDKWLLTSWKTVKNCSSPAIVTGFKFVRVTAEASNEKPLSVPDFPDAKVLSRELGKPSLTAVITYLNSVSSLTCDNVNPLHLEFPKLSNMILSFSVPKAFRVP